MGVFEISSNRFDNGPDFNTYLSENYSALSNDDLYIISGITELSQSDFEQKLIDLNWVIDDQYGAIKKIGNQYSENFRCEAYLYFDEDQQLLFFYTNQRKTEEIDDALIPLLNKMVGVHYLYVSPHILREVVAKIAEQNESAKVTEFIAKRTKGTETPAQRRRYRERTINYYGDDGLRTLREMETEYGVLPHILEIDIPGQLNFRINKQGVFTLKRGSLTQMFSYIDECIVQCLDIKEAYDSTRVNKVHISEGDTISQSTPARIGTNLVYEDIRPLQESLRGNDYSVIDSNMLKGSVYYSSKIYDQKNNFFFNLVANGDGIRVFPKKERDISTFFRFFELVQSNVDEQADIEAIDRQVP